MTGEAGTIYCLHFRPAYRHARHYVGWTGAPERRFREHLAGRGSPLVRAAVAAGCEVVVAWTRPGTRSDERKIKLNSHVPRSVPGGGRGGRVSGRGARRATRRARTEEGSSMIEPGRIVVEFEPDRETKNARRFEEQGFDEAVGTLYLRKRALGQAEMQDAKKLRVTIESIDG